MSSKNDSKPLTDLRRALDFLTRFPIGDAVADARGSLAAAAWAFPLVGAVIGAIGGGAYWIASSAGLSPALAGLAAVGAACLVTGCLHEDGLADVADGFGGGSGREAKLAIMRDSRVGSYGVIALCVSILARVLALAALAEPGAALPALVAAGALSRAAIVPVMAGLSHARADGMSSYAGRPSAAATAAALVFGAIVAVVALGFGSGMLAIVVALLAALLIAFLSRHQIGGQTGDVLGAVQQTSETAILLALASNLV